MWYETAPYYAYYYTGRYQDVINLAEANLNKIMATRSLEESWYLDGPGRICPGQL